MADFSQPYSNGIDHETAPWQPAVAQPSLADTARLLQTDLRILAMHAREAGEELHDVLEHNVRERPYTTLAAAASVGYLLGGGLGSRMTVMMFGVATRLAMAMAAREMQSWTARNFGDKPYGSPL